MRVEQQETDRLEEIQPVARKAFASFVLRANEGGERYWGRMEVPYFSWYAYVEVLAPFHDAPEKPGTLLAAFERLTSVLTDGAVNALLPAGELQRRSVFFIGEAEERKREGMKARSGLRKTADELLARKGEWERTRSEGSLLREEEVEGLVHDPDLLRYALSEPGFDIFADRSIARLRRARAFWRKAGLGVVAGLLATTILGIMIFKYGAIANDFDGAIESSNFWWARALVGCYGALGALTWELRRVSWQLQESITGSRRAAVGLSWLSAGLTAVSGAVAALLAVFVVVPSGVWPALGIAFVAGYVVPGLRSQIVTRAESVRVSG